MEEVNLEIDWTEVLQTGFGISVLKEFRSDIDAQSYIGKRIGNYLITSLIGEGGMATIYKAKRDDNEFEREVAIKFIKPSVSTDESKRRFAAERNILASLSHNNIAKLFDSGITEEGQPFFIMELVDGLQLNEFLEKHTLDTSTCLNIFKKILGATAYAHANAVIHKDIKPSNIIIDEAGTPYVLDFGIASLNSQQNLGNQSYLDSMNSYPVSLRFASPELLYQESVNVKSDIFQLGLILHLMVFGFHVFDNYNAAEILEFYQTNTSIDFSNSSSKSNDKALSFNSQARTEILAIVRKCTHFNPQERYDSVDALLNDIQRIEQVRTVSAMPPTLLYRTSKLISRNALFFTLLTFSLMLLATSTSFYIHNVINARNEAQFAAKKSERVTQLLVDIFDAQVPTNSPKKLTTANELLERSLLDIPKKLVNEPDIHTQINIAISEIFVKSLELERAENLLLSSPTNVSEKTAHLRLIALANVQNMRGKYDEALTSIAMAEQYFYQLKTTELNHWVDAISVKASTLRNMGKVDEAIEVVSATLAEDIDWDSHPLEVADLYLRKGANELFSHASATVDSLKTAEKYYIRFGGHNYYKLADVYNRLGHYYSNERELQLANTYLEQAYQTLDQYEALDEKARLSNLYSHGLNLRALGEVLKSKQKFEKSYEIALELYGRDFGHPNVLLVLINLAHLQFQMGDIDEAISAIKMATDKYREGGEKYIHHWSSAEKKLAGFYRDIGKYESALTHSKQAFEISEIQYEPDTRRYIESLFTLADSVCWSGDASLGFQLMNLSEAQRNFVSASFVFQVWQEEVLAVCHLAARNYEKAKSTLQNLITSTSNKTSYFMQSISGYHYMLAFISWKEQSWENALKSINKAKEKMLLHPSYYHSTNPITIKVEALHHRILIDSGRLSEVNDEERLRLKTHKNKYAGSFPLLDLLLHDLE